VATKQFIQRALKGMAVLAVLCLGTLCFGETVVVRVISGVEGLPLSGQPVTMQLRYGKTATEEAHTILLRYTTDFSGEAEFPLPLAKPQALNVDVKFEAKGLRCSCRVLTETETVLREGLTVANPAHGSKTPAVVKPRPGQIVFIARPSSFLQKVIYDY
jgi:hypothetical protein